ncbi:MAG: hypothetical protein ACYC8W_00755 [Candidatus Tyrphobacter sp.]
MEREIDCSQERAASSIYAALGVRGSSEVTKTFRVGAIGRDVRLTLGDLDRKSDLWRIPVSWQVPESDAFPIFHGFFEVQRRPDDRIAVVLLGYYQPPFGAAGAVFDAFVGRWIANVTVSQMLDEIEATIHRDGSAS